MAVANSEPPVEIAQPADGRIIAKVAAGERTEWPLYHSGGCHRAVRGGVLEVHEPASRELLAVVPDGTREDLDLAVGSAAAAQIEWARTRVSERSELLKQLAGRVLEASDDLGVLDARQTGSPVTAMRRDAVLGANSILQTTESQEGLEGTTYPVRWGGLHFTTREPFGVVGRIIAFNHPVLFACARLAPALLAGNAVVLKPSEQAPLGALAVAQLASDIFPTGLVSVLTGGPTLGAEMARHPLLRRMSFTGSLPIALKIAAGAAESGVLKTITYELGGKNAIVVRRDADIERAADAVVRGMNFTRVQGQSCGSTSRLVCHEDIHDSLVELVRERLDGLRVGDPLDPTTEMGCLINEAAVQRCISHVDRAVGQGARLVRDGRVGLPEGLPPGPYLGPTLLTDVSPESATATTELFGPVLITHRFRTDEEALAIANGVSYGLTAAVWSQDISAALTLAAGIEAGYVWVNDVETRYPGIPIGGWKDSGSGLESGAAEVMDFTRVKSVNVTHG